MLFQGLSCQKSHPRAAENLTNAPKTPWVSFQMTVTEIQKKVKPSRNTLLNCNLTNSQKWEEKHI